MATIVANTRKNDTIFNNPNTNTVFTTIADYAVFINDSYDRDNEETCEYNFKGIAEKEDTRTTNNETEGAEGAKTERHECTGWKFIFKHGYTETVDKEVLGKEGHLLSPSISAVKVWKHPKKGLCVVFRGSQTLGEWISNLNVGGEKLLKPSLVDNNLFTYEEVSVSDESKTNEEIGDDESKGGQEIIVTDNKTSIVLKKTKVHKGFLDGYECMRDPLRKVIEKNIGNNNIWFCGHSRGGAIASIAAVDIANKLKLEKNRIKSLTIGSPAVGDEIFRKLYEVKIGSKNTYRMINCFDPVPLLFDAVNYKERKEMCKHVCDPYILDFGPVQVMTKEVLKIAEVNNKIEEIGKNAYKHHLCVQYLKNMYENQTEWQFWVKLIKRVPWEKIAEKGFKFIETNASNGGRILSYVNDAVTNSGGGGIANGGKSLMNPMNATPLGWANLAVNVVGHAATNYHIHKMWNDMSERFDMVDKRFDVLEDLMKDVKRAVEGAEKRMIETVKQEVAGLQVAIKSEAKKLHGNISKKIELEFTRDYMIKLIASTNNLSSYLNDDITWENINPIFTELQTRLFDVVTQINNRSNKHELIQDCTKYTLLTCHVAFQCFEKGKNSNTNSYINGRRKALIEAVAPHAYHCIRDSDHFEEAVQISKCFDSLCLHMDKDIFDKLLQSHVGEKIKFSRNFHLISIYNDAPGFAFNSNNNTDNTSLVHWKYPVRERLPASYNEKDLIDLSLVVLMINSGNIYSIKQIRIFQHLCNLLKQISTEADNISIQTMKDELKQIRDEVKKLTLESLEAQENDDDDLNDEIDEKLRTLKKRKETLKKDLERKELESNDENSDSSSAREVVKRFVQVVSDNVKSVSKNNLQDAIELCTKFNDDLVNLNNGYKNCMPFIKIIIDEGKKLLLRQEKERQERERKERERKDRERQVRERKERVRKERERKERERKQKELYKTLNEKYKKEFPRLTPLVCACEKGRMEDVEGMIRGARAAGMDVTAMVSELGTGGSRLMMTFLMGPRTPLMAAAHYEHSTIIEILLQCNADTAATNDVGRNALHIAAWNNKTTTTTVQLLLNNMKLEDINHIDTFGSTPLDICYYYNDISIRQQLIDLIRQKGGKRKSEL